GELFTLMGAFRSESLPLWVPALSTLGIVLAAAYFLWTFQRMFLGTFWYAEAKNVHLLQDLNAREFGLLVPLALLTLLLGLLPGIFFDLTGPTVQAWLNGLR